MAPKSCIKWMLALLMVWSSLASAEDGKVEMPLDEWEQIQTEIEDSKKAEKSHIPYCPIDREVEGSFRKGLFTGRLTSRLKVLDDRGHIRVPVLDAGASLGKVLLNGKRTSLLREGGMYTLGVDRPGDYTISVEFFWGREQVDFARKLRFRLPEAGVTKLTVQVPELDIEAKLENGALVSQTQTASGTRLEGNLDAKGLFDLAWTRKLTHKASEAVRLQARLDTLFTVQDAQISGLAVFDFEVLEGETARIDLGLPEGIEVVGVEGEAVLQWWTEAGDGGKLTVLLRHLVSERVRLAVRFQFPSAEGKPVQLLMPLPAKGVKMSGSLGVQGPAGLNVQVASLKQAKQLKARDLPPELTDLTTSPLQHGFSFTQAPAVRLVVARHDEVQLTSTLIDELQASSVIIEDGTEITKLKLRMRNNTAQYLTLQLPKGASLTHALVDGRPIRPATAKLDGREALLFPLRQSERIGADQSRIHRVRDGETLSGIANFYYSDPNQWANILTDNEDQIGDAQDVMVGMELSIPAKQGVKVEESSFAIELAYKNTHADLGSLGSFGQREFALPVIREVDVVKATWHLYLPTAVEPLSFDANLTQYSAIRYDPFRRLRDFLSGLWWTRAWAGGKYKSILIQRKEIYRTTTAMRGSSEAVLATFPLVGERYKFRRSLLGRDTPRIAVTFAAAWLSAPMRWLAFLAGLGLTMLLLRNTRKTAAWLGIGLGMLGLLVLAHYFLGMHRRILWGINAALLWSILRLRWGPFWTGVKNLLQSPWGLVDLLTLRNLAFVVGLCSVLWFVIMWPLLLSTTGLVVLSFWWRRKARLATKEVSHA
jgi:hypothetical protein